MTPTPRAEVAMLINGLIRPLLFLNLIKVVRQGLTCVVFALVSMWKENRFGWPLRGSSGSPSP